MNTFCPRLVELYEQLAEFHEDCLGLAESVHALAEYHEFPEHFA